MTAAIVTTYNREPITTYARGRDADSARIVGQGRSTLPHSQLWERVAESKRNNALYSVRLVEAILNARFRAVLAGERIK